MKGAGRVGSKKVVGAGDEAELREERPLRRSQCRQHLERTVTREFRKIVAGFVLEAKKGGCAHMKMAAELVDPSRPGVKRRRKGTVQKLLEKIGE